MLIPGSNTFVELPESFSLFPGVGYLRHAWLVESRSVAVVAKVFDNVKFSPCRQNRIGLKVHFLSLFGPCSEDIVCNGDRSSKCVHCTLGIVFSVLDYVVLGLILVLCVICLVVKYHALACL